MTIQDSIKHDIESTPVILYMKGNKLAPQCGFSAQVVQILNDMAITYETRDVLQDDALRQGIKDYSDWPTVPQLYSKGQFIGGCDIITELYQTGELETYLR